MKVAQAAVGFALLAIGVLQTWLAGAGHYDRKTYGIALMILGGDIIRDS